MMMMIYTKKKNTKKLHIIPKVLFLLFMFPEFHFLPNSEKNTKNYLVSNKMRTSFFNTPSKKQKKKKKKNTLLNHPIGKSCDLTKKTKKKKKKKYH